MRLNSFFSVHSLALLCSFFFFNDTATTEIYTLSLHDALPICGKPRLWWRRRPLRQIEHAADRKSTRLNSSHVAISYAVFCLKKKKNAILAFLLKTKKKTIKRQTEKTAKK